MNIQTQTGSYVLDTDIQQRMVDRVKHYCENVPEAAHLFVAISVRKHNRHRGHSALFTVETTAEPCHGQVVRAEASGADVESTIDLMLRRLRRQLRVVKDKATERQKPANKYAVPALEALNVRRTKTVEVEPISVDEAILRLEAVGHDFYMFTDKGKGEPAVVYKRIDGGYGVLSGEVPSV